jgi:putative endonuclease
VTDRPWSLYLVRCSDGTLYTGITTDVERRVREHNGRGRGAKYTSKRQPVTLVYHRLVGTRVEALTEERRVKKFTRARKLGLISPRPRS